MSLTELIALWVETTCYAFKSLNNEQKEFKVERDIVSLRQANKLYKESIEWLLVRRPYTAVDSLEAAINIHQKNINGIAMPAPYFFVYEVEEAISEILNPFMLTDVIHAADQSVAKGELYHFLQWISAWERDHVPEMLGTKMFLDLYWDYFFEKLLRQYCMLMQISYSRVDRLFIFSADDPFTDKMTYICSSIIRFTGLTLTNRCCLRVYIPSDQPKKILLTA